MKTNKMGKIDENFEEFKHFLLLLNNIYNNHYRGSDLTQKIEQIIENLSNSITQTFSDIGIFDIFKNNKKIVLFLFDKKILTINIQIFKRIFFERHSEKNCPYFFYPEIKSFFKKEIVGKIEEKIISIDSNILKNFDERRHIGENDQYLASLTPYIKKKE